MNGNKNLGKYVDEIYNKWVSETEIWKCDFLAEQLRYEGDKRTNKEVIKSAIRNILEGVDNINEENIMDYVHGWADANTEIRTTEIFRLYSINAYAFTYIEEAKGEFGEAEDIIQQLQWGLFKSLFDFAYFVLSEYMRMIKEEKIKEV